MTLVPKPWDVEKIFSGRLGIVATARAEAKNKSSTADAIGQQRKQLSQTLEKYLTLPCKKQYLGHFIVTVENARSNVENLLKIVDSEDNELRQQLHAMDQGLLAELEYLSALASFTSGHGAAKIRRVV